MGVYSSKTIIFGRKFFAKYNNGAEIVFGIRKKRTGDSLLKKLTGILFINLFNILGGNVLKNHADLGGTYGFYNDTTDKDFEYHLWFVPYSDLQLRNYSDEELKEFLEAVSLAEGSRKEQEVAEAQQQVLNKAQLKIYIG